MPKESGTIATRFDLEEAALRLRVAAAAGSSDTLPRLVYSDWLLDQGRYWEAVAVATTTRRNRGFVACHYTGRFVQSGIGSGNGMSCISPSDSCGGCGSGILVGSCHAAGGVVE